MSEWPKTDESQRPGVSAPRPVTPAPPLEMLLPDTQMGKEMPELGMAATFLRLLAESNVEIQRLEIFPDSRLVTTPVPAIKTFLSDVNGAKQVDAFVAQIKFMLFAPRSAGAMGSLCCLSGDLLTEFEISERRNVHAAVSWEIVRRSVRSTLGFDNAEQWSQWCFLGFAPVRAETIEGFDPGQVQSLLSLVQAERVIGSVSPLDPRHLINHKGVTAWSVLFVLALLKNKKGLQAVAEGTGLILVPDDVLRPAFSSHVNWPAQVLDRYRLEPHGAYPFVLPFIVHNSAPRPQQLQRSLRAPDGALEVWAVVEFNESEPEKLLAVIQRVAEHIDKERDEFPTKSQQHGPRPS